MPKITMNHGSGGREMHEFIKNTIISKLKNGVLEKMDDSAVLVNPGTDRLAMTTDSYVVNPIKFAGGDIGRLSVSGTVNDITTSGAKPYAMSLAFIVEEGMDLKLIEEIVESIAITANEADIKIVTGDTKVVEKGKGDNLFINTAGIGFINNNVNISTYNTVPGDDIIISGPIGNHEIAMMKARGMIDFECVVESDVRPLNKEIERLIDEGVELHTIKDPTRGGVAGALIEIVEHAGVEILLDQSNFPIDDVVNSVCRLVGYDPLYLANEGKFLITGPPESSKKIIESFNGEAKVIGKANKSDDPKLLLETEFGGIRRVGMLETMQLPRIC